MTIFETPPSDHHATWEDVLGILTGVTLVALGLLFLRAGDLITGQISGLALIVAYGTGWSFGLLFFIFNLPFYVLALRQLGLRFTLRTMATVTALSVMIEVLPLAIPLPDLHPGISAIMFGFLTGVGLLSLFRHGATLGGVGIVALWLQDTRGIAAGKVQLGFDLIIFASAFTLFPPVVVVWSLAGATLLNVIILVNHRRDRYIARS